MNESSRGWTWGRSTILLLLLLDITVVAIWLIVYFDYYDNVSRVVGGIWGAVLVVLGALGIKARGQTSLAEFMGLPPVKLVTACYTGLIFAALPIYALLELPIHRLTVTGPELPASTSVAMTLMGEADTAQHHHTGTWQGYVQAGDYTVVYEPEGFEPESLSTSVGTFSLSSELVYGQFAPLKGRLLVSVRPDVRLRIRTLDGLVIDALDVYAESPAELSLVPGEYTVEASAVGYESVIDTARVSLEGTREIQFELDRLPDPPTLGTVDIRNPREMAIIVDGKPTDRITPEVLSLPPGERKVELQKKVGDQFGQRIEQWITVTAGERVVIDAPEPDAIRLAELIVIPTTPGTEYWLDRQLSSTYLGRLEGTSRFFIFPGQHRLLAGRGGDETEFSASFDAGSQTTTIRF